MRILILVTSPQQRAELQKRLESLMQIYLPELPIRFYFQEGVESDWCFVASDWPAFKKTVKRLRGRSHYITHVVSDRDEVPSEFLTGEIDGVTSEPYSDMELLTQLKAFQTAMQWQELSRVHQDMETSLGELQKDLAIAERLQQKRFPSRLPEVKGFDVVSRYLVGQRSGGDHFDLIKGKDHNGFSFYLTDASSYGLSSFVMGAMMRVAATVADGHTIQSAEVLERVSRELIGGLGEEDHLSVLYGIYRAQDRTLNYVSLGSSLLYVIRSDGKLDRLPTQGKPLQTSSGWTDVAGEEVQFFPEDRLLIVSDGILEGLGSRARFEKWVQANAELPPKKMVTEILFGIKERLEDEGFPPQDCSIMILGMRSNVLPLRKTKLRRVG